MEKEEKKAKKEAKRAKKEAEKYPERVKARAEAEQKRKARFSMDKAGSDASRSLTLHTNLRDQGWRCVLSPLDRGLRKETLTV